MGIMRGGKLPVVGVAAALLLLANWAAWAQGPGPSISVEAMRGERRVALVIGNAGYAPPANLKNPLNDARDVAQALGALGFDVVLQTDADLRTMQRAVREFAARLRPDGVGLFYYAGHGVQVRGNNYLVPLGARIAAETEVEDEALDVNRMLRVMEDSRSRISVVVLDACRDNPFARAFRGPARGLALMPAPTGSFIAFATSPGAVAADGTGRNGFFTGELLQAMRTPGLDIVDVFRRVIGRVRERTNGRQVPWTLSSLDGYFYFSLPQGAAPAPRIEIQEEVRPRLGSLAVSARLDGVEVWLDDQRMGETRQGRTLVVNNVSEGTHRLRAQKAGHKDWQREIQVTASQRAEAVIDIEPLGPAKVIKGDDGAEMVLVPAGDFLMGSDAAEVARFKEECKKARRSDESCTRWHDRETPRHRVHLDAYYIDRYEVTNALFDRFVRATSHRTVAEREGDGWVWQQKDGKWQRVTVSGATWRNPGGSGTSAPANHPVVQVAWPDADAYCRWAGKRLPTEAEWEKAARGTDGRRYPWGEGWATTSTVLSETHVGLTRGRSASCAAGPG
jgi:formylglycine-generating enzyme required for sulfatase activity